MMHWAKTMTKVPFPSVLNMDAEYGKTFKWMYLSPGVNIPACLSEKQFLIDLYNLCFFWSSSLCWRNTFIPPPPPRLLLASMGDSPHTSSFHTSPHASPLCLHLSFGAKLREPRQAVAPGSALSDVPAHSAQPVHPWADGPFLHARLEPKDHRHLRSDRDGPR